MALERIVEGLIRREKLLPPNVTVVIGVSGGADSLALLHIFTQLQKTLGLRVIAATLDHGVRGEAGASDAAFVVEMATAWGLEVHRERADVPALAAAWKMSIEAAARRARYDFFARVAHTVDAEYVFTAHNADDQAETVLMRLLRGAGSDGLAGMSLSAPMPYHPEITLVRPLLTTTRAHIEDYCRLHGLQYRTDETNTDTRYLRNRVRHEVIPHLRQINPNIQATLSRVADVARIEADYMQSIVSDFIAAQAVVRSEQVSIKRSAFDRVHPAVKRRVLKWAVDHLQSVDAVTEVTTQHIENAIEILAAGQTGTTALLADGWQVRLDYDAMVIESQYGSDHMGQPLLDMGETVSVQVPGVSPFGGQYALYASPDRNESPDSGGMCTLAFPPGAVVQLRGRQEGDNFTPFGMNGHHKRVSAWMVDRKVPEVIRQRLPLIVIRGQIAAILYGTGAWVIDERFKMTLESINVYYFWVTQLPNPS